MTIPKHQTVPAEATDEMLEAGFVGTRYDAGHGTRADVYRAMLAAAPPPPETVDIVFDGPPGPTPGRFVEVEDAAGKSIKFGEWVKRPDGYWALRISPPEDRMLAEALVALKEAERFAWDDHATLAHAAILRGIAALSDTTRLRANQPKATGGR